jgi:putative effector of murein hydrolase
MNNRRRLISRVPLAEAVLLAACQRGGHRLGARPARRVLASLAPKSVTAPVAMGIAAQLGGIPALAAVFAVLTGLAALLMPLVPSALNLL